ncbi:MAG: LuxR C-terminal-related transcriptional regulator [Myroides sp.]
MKKIITLLVFISTLSAFGNSISLKKLTHEIEVSKNLGNHEASIKLVCNFLAQPNITSAERYEAYLLKSGIYRSLYKYEHALHNLDLAFKEGIKGDNKAAVEQEIKAERSFIYFDLQVFDKSEKLTTELEESGYKNLDPKYLLFLYTQKGYFLLKAKEYSAAEEILNKAYNLSMQYFPAELPIIFGKQIELYHHTGNVQKRDLTYKAGIQSARQAHNIKYEFYLEEVMKNVFSSSKDYKNAFFHQQKCDSLFSLYNSNINSSKVELLEQQLKTQEYSYSSQKKYYMLLTIAVFALLLLLLLFITYKLYKNTKLKNKFITEENERIQKEIKYHLQISEQTQSSNKNKLDGFHFTERQLQIIDLLKKGRSNKEIAAELFISDNTVKYHLKIIYNVLNIKQRNELLIMYAS